MVVLPSAGDRRRRGQLPGREGLPVHHHHFGHAPGLLLHSLRHGTCTASLCARRDDGLAQADPLRLRQALTFIFLKAQYHVKHYLGVALCLAGLGVLVASDAYYNRNEGTFNPRSEAHSQRPHPIRTDGEDPVVGDILCLCGALLYSISNVGQEGSVKQFDRVEFLAMLGLFGSGLNVAQSYTRQLSRLTLQLHSHCLSLSP